MKKSVCPDIADILTCPNTAWRAGKALRLSLCAAIMIGVSSGHVLAQNVDDPAVVFGQEPIVIEDEAGDGTDEVRSFGRINPIGGVDQNTPIAEDDAYAQQGIRLGNFVIRPSIEIGLSATNNVSNSSSGAPPVITETTSNSLSISNTATVVLNSDWSRHALEAGVTGSLPLGLTGEADDATYRANANLRLDVSSATTLTLDGVFSSETEGPQSSAYFIATDPILNPGVTGTNDPRIQSYSGSATLAHDFGGFNTRITAAINRLQYGAAQLNNGSSVSQSDLNSTTYDVALRGGYALSGVLSPFVEANYGLRIFDQPVDASGVERDATRYGLRLGTVIDMGEKLSGEIAVGYAAEKLRDDNFDSTQAVTLAAALNWSPVRNTDVSLNVRTAIEPNGAADIAASTVYATELGLTRRLRDNLTANAGLNAEFETFDGPRASTTTVGGQVGLAYSFNRYMALTGRLSYQKAFSADVTSRESTASAFIGLRLQR